MAGYRVIKQREGTRVSWWPDPRGPNHDKCYLGTVIDHLGDNIFIVWDEDGEVYEVWDARECRYRVDRGQMRFIPPPKKRRVRLPDDQIFCKTCGKPRQLKCGCPRPGAVKPEEWGNKSLSKSLTGSSKFDTIVSSSMHERSDDAQPPTKGATEMATKTEPLSAKEAATELGTDARTLRKFLRKRNGLVGQGQRWAIDRKDLKALKKEFDAWAKGTAEKAADKAEAKSTTKTKAPAKSTPLTDEEIYGSDDLSDLDDEFEALNDEDLEELDEV